MCLILFAYNAHPHYQLILAANRDEFYARQTAPAEFWPDAPELCAGKDLASGGTWLGITKSGRFAAVTNYRDPNAPSGTKSRGWLTRDFLIGEETPEYFLRKIERERSDYSGFNLLVGDFGEDGNELFYFSNRGKTIEKLDSGIYGLSNALLDTKWYKVEQNKAKFLKVVENSDEIIPEDLFGMLADRQPAPDEKLPETGVGIERERILSAAFIATNGYGTRSTTVLLINKTNQSTFIEKTSVSNAVRR